MTSKPWTLGILALAGLLGMSALAAATGPAGFQAHASDEGQTHGTASEQADEQATDRSRPADASDGDDAADADEPADGDDAADADEPADGDDAADADASGAPTAARGKAADHKPAEPGAQASEHRGQGLETAMAHVPEHVAAHLQSLWEALSDGLRGLGDFLTKPLHPVSA